MLRIIAKTIGLIALALAVITAILDITRSIANSAATITPLAEQWAQMDANSLVGFGAFIEKSVGAPWLWQSVLVPIISMPSWIVFGLLAAIFLWMGRRKERRWRQRFGS